MTNARKFSSRTRLALVAVLVTVLLTLAALVWVLIVYPSQPAVGDDERVPFELLAGEDAAEVSARLQQAGVIEHDWAFAMYLRSTGAAARLRSGTVLVHRGRTPQEVARQIARGLGPSNVRVTLVEGMTRFQIGERLESVDVCDAEEFLRATEEADLLSPLGRRAGEPGFRSLEGFLFPDTYEFGRDTDAEEVAERLRDNYLRRVGPVFEENAAALAELGDQLGWGEREVLTLASIVEKEAQAPSERATIAGVFINRLLFEEFRPKRLQADPTVSYGCRALPEVSEPCRSYDGRITRPMLRDRANPYNTYAIEGLPPGPIANPGRASVEAVLQWERHRYLYFVATNNGRHHFSENLDEHNRAVNLYVRGIPDGSEE